MLSNQMGYFSFQMAGFPVRIYYSNLMICALLGFLWGANSGLLAGLALAILFFLSIFLHECGHAFAAEWQNVRVYEMELDGMGGRVRHQGGANDRSGLWITLAGPLVNLALAVLGQVLAGFWLVDGVDIFAALSRVNLLLAVFNLLPIVPLDGGYILYRILRLMGIGRKDKFGRGKSADQIIGQIGVIAGYIWIPAAILLFLTTGIIFFFFPPIEYSKELASGARRISG